MTENTENTDVNDERDPEATPAHEPDQAEQDGQQPGHRGNDMSRMTLLETDLAELARKDIHEDRDPIPGVQEALQKLNEMDVDIDKMDNA